MSNTDVSSFGGGTLLRASQDSFDMQSESDVIALLRTIHQNPIEPDLKNHLRDLIFSYRQSGATSDLAVLEKAFKELGIATTAIATPIVTVAVTKTPAALPILIMGTSRPRPRFAAVTAVSFKPALEAVVVVKSPSIGVPSYIEEPAEVATVAVSAPEVEPQIVPEVITAITPTPVPEPVPVQETDTTNVLDVAAEVVTPALTYANPSERIKEIKHFVNEKVGNPINLIDAHNEVGREYMNALLDAMKKSNGGDTQEVTSAMDRLEKSFVAVQEVMLNGVSPMSQAVPQTPVVSVLSAEVVTPKIATDSNPVKITVVEEVKTPVSTIKVEPIKTEESGVRKAPMMPSVASTLQGVQSAVEKEVPSYTTPVVPAAQIEAMAHTTAMHSVADDKELQDSVRLNREEISSQLQKVEALKVAQMDPLLTPEVTSGLGQLLSEWSLFKSSGIFGTGPSGKDHVLYVKLAQLTMSAVVAGRFEGVTPKIKQSIGDYMNGWRYEEGVVHEPSETFEHYLRRVIKHILSKQTK